MKEGKLHIIKIPHLNYVVVVEDKKKEDRPNAYAYCERVFDGESRICIPLPVGMKRSSRLLHEIIHVLQNICHDRNIDFYEEAEHTAYIGDWLFQEIIKL
jgi:hypothetical protein